VPDTEEEKSLYLLEKKCQGLGRGRGSVALARGKGPRLGKGRGPSLKEKARFCGKTTGAWKGRRGGEREGGC